MTVPVLLGLPYDGSSSFLRGPAKAPQEIRSALRSSSANWFSEGMVDLAPDTGRWIDIGDVELPDEPSEALPLVRGAAASAASDGAPVVSLGGDHSVTWPLLQALSERTANLTIIHFDAHPDLYDELDGSRLSHACPFARIMEEDLADRLLQFGIRTMTQHQAEQVERFGVEVHTAAMWTGELPEIDGPVYVSIDMDALDPAFAPGVSHHEAGGLTTRQILNALHRLGGMDVEVVGADVVELNPDRDVNGVSAMVAAKLVKELLVLTGL